jgi:hypothetical protein
MFAIGTRETDRHRKVIAFARRAHTLTAREHADADALDDLGHATLEIGVGAAHCGDFENAGELESLSRLFGLEFV